MIIFYALASLVFWVGTIYDAASSRGQVERTRIFRDKVGYFSLPRYLIATGGLYAAATVLCWRLDDGFSWATAGASLAGWGAWRFIQARKNQRLKKSA